MAWTYNPALLSTSPLMQLRLEIGDTDSTDQLLADEEIAYAITVEATLNGTQARCCDIIARKFARLTSNTLGPSKIEAQQKYEHYRREATRLRKMDIMLNAPFVSGTTWSEEAVPDSDVKPKVFGIDMMNAEPDETLVEG